MKVKFIQTMGGKDFIYEVDSIHELKKETALRFIEHGICEEVKVVKGSKKKK